MGSGGVDESDREGIPDGTDFFHAAIIDRSDLSGASYFVSREKIAELLEFDSRRFMGVRPKIGGTDARIQGGMLVWSRLGSTLWDRKRRYNSEEIVNGIE